MSERKIVSIEIIDTDTEVGQLLAAAIAKITTESQTDKTPYEVLDQLHELADEMFKERRDSIYIESMTSITTANGPIRCWRMEEDQNFEHKETEKEIRDKVSEFENSGHISQFESEQSQKMALSKAILSLPRMNAVEFLDHRKNGIVLYKNWP